MAKIALIADTHFGNRNDNKALLSNQVKFFENVFFPYVDAHEIRHVIHLGDTVDRRKYVNFNTSKALTATLVQPLWDRGIESHFILGNHDVFFKDTNEVNALDELYGNSVYLDKMTIYKDPATIEVDGLKILLLPWICAGNREASYEAIATSSAPVLMGHLELAGFEMYRGAVAEHGMGADLFANFELVCSGHYHHKSTTGSINYLGSTGQYTWSDHGDARGFHVLDTDTRELTFVANPYHMFNRFVYDDLAKSPEEMMKFNAANYADTFVKLIVKNKSDPYLLEKVIDKFEKHDIINLQVIEDKLQVLLEDEEDVIDEAEDTLSILNKYIAGMAYVDKPRLERFMFELYNEALNIV